MSHSYSRDKLEESRRRKRAQQQRTSLPSTNSWRGVTPSQVAKPAQQTAPKTTAPKQNKTAPKTSTQTPQQNIQSAIRSGASYRGISPAQVSRNVSRPVVSLPVIHAAQERAQQVAQNDNSMRARIARSHEAERQRLAANAAAIKQDKSRLASNSLLWHQTTDASRRRQLEQENAAIRTRRGYAFDSRTGSTFDSKGNELTLAARQIYGGKLADRVESLRQLPAVSRSKDFVRDARSTASQPSILEAVRGATSDDPYYAIQSGQKAHSIIASLLNRSGETWTDADTKARDEARTALQNEMTALFRHYGVDYQPRWNEQQTADMLRRAGADEGTVTYAMENVRLRDSTDRLGQGFEAIGKRAVASIPSLIDTAKQALANRNEDYENDEYRSLTEREQALEAQLQSMVSQNADGSVPEDYQRVYDELQNVRNRANAIKTTKGVDPNAWSQTMLREANEAQANAEAGLAPAPRWLTEQAISLAGNAPSMAISALPGGTILGSALIGAQAAGQRTFELNEQGKSAGEALGRGAVSGIIEAATEKLPLERMAEILHSGGANAVKNILRQMGTEATEEGVSYFLNYVSDLAAADPDAKFSLAELAQSAAGGAFGGLVFGTAGTVGAKLAQRTEWNDTENNPVVAAIHLNKQGVVDDVNMLASAYGKRNLAALLGENNENVIYTKNNKGINQTLDGRLQLPGLLSDDTLVAYSIRQNAGNSNTSDTNIPLSEAMQYGKTPEQAMREARAKADESRSSSDFDTSDISPDTENGNTENAANRQAGLPGNYQRHGKSVDQAMRELQNKLTEKHSFLYDDDSKQVRAVQSAALRETWILARPVHEQIERFKQDHPLSSRDEQLLQAALVNDATDTFSRCDDPAAVMHRYQLQQELNRRMQPIRDYQRARGETMALNAEEMADTIAEFAKDKKIPGAYSRETMERNSYDIFGKNNRDKAEQLNDEYFAPVHKAVADRTNYMNTMRQQVADLHLNKHESALVQMALEGRNDVAAEYIKNNNIKITSKLQKNVADGVATFQAIYKELYDSLNETLLSNGMEPVRARKNYAPHFVKDKPDTMLGRIRFTLGLGKDSNLALPTDIAGITDDFSPGKKWFGNLLQRKGELTDYDAVAGFDRYIETAGDVIFLTDSVQQLRSLEDALRYRLSDEGTREKVNQIRNDRNLNALERHQKIDEAYNSNQDNIQKLYNQKKQGMGGYVSNLHEYINNLAGKKARADRGWEEMIGRQMYTVAKNVEERVAANMIAANPGSWITNFIPITQVSGEVSTANIIRAMRDTVKSAVKDDGFTDGSVFLTNREGTQLLDRTLTRKVSDIAGMPMEAIDHFTSNVVTRAKYLQNIQNGMNVQEAFDNADTFAANLMADRSKGAQPTAFNSVNPIRKVFTMFQLEVNNQLSYLFKDLPRAKQSVPKLAWAYTKVFTGAYLFNAVYHQLTGRDSAFDPIGMIADAFGFDPFDDDEDKKKSGVDIALDLGKNAAEQIPFVGGLIGGGRVPISAAFPDFGKLIEEYENGYDKKRIALDAAKSAANSAAYLLLPFGGGALKRTIEGAATVGAGGSYSYNKNGEKILQFPVYGQTPRDWAQAMLFGKSSLKTAQDWAENGYDTLNAKETKAFDTLRERMSWHGEDNSEAVYAAIKAMRELDADAQKRYPSNYKDFAATRKRQMLMQSNALSAGQKDFLDRELISGGQSGTYTSQDAFDISQTVRESRQKAANEALKHGITAEMFADWDSVLEMLSEAQNDDGSKTYTTNTALGEVLKEIEANTGMTAGEKEALSDYLLTTAMSESDRDKWNDEVKGKVNASDYVRFKSDLSAYQKEYKGTGADNAANIAEILRGYTNLTDEQRGVLMNTYSETAKSNPFHVSDLEKKLADNSFYKDLNDSGRETLRTYCNEYEQAIADGKDLSGWKAKAYMAKEAGITPETYALFQTALKACDYDENGSYKSAEIEAAVKLLPGLTDKQRGYLWQAAKGGKASKNNPWGTTNVTKYTGGSSSGSAVNPVEGGTISSGFGPRSSPTEGASSMHKAIDIAAPLGTAVRAAMPGKIVEVTKGYNGGYGNTVSVDHGNGIITKYHHMQDGSIDGVSVGQEVTAGQQIGAVGSTGISTGPHLDFQVVKDGDFVDPRKYIPGYGSGNDYLYSGSSSAGAIASGRAAAESYGSSKKSGGSSGRSGGTSWSGLKNLKKLPTFK